MAMYYYMSVAVIYVYKVYGIIFCIMFVRPSVSILRLGAMLYHHSYCWWNVVGMLLSHSG